MRRFWPLFSSLSGAAVLCLLPLALPPQALATPADSTRTGKRCDTCHQTMTSKYLNLVGFYYKRKHTLAGAPLEQMRLEKRSRGPSDSYQPRYVPGRSSAPRSSR